MATLLFIANWLLLVNFFCSSLFYCLYSAFVASEQRLLLFSLLVHWTHDRRDWYDETARQFHSAYWYRRAFKQWSRDCFRTQSNVDKGCFCGRPILNYGNVYRCTVEHRPGSNDNDIDVITTLQWGHTIVLNEIGVMNIIKVNKIEKSNKK